MIGRVYRGHGTAGLIRYLYGPARSESPVAHHDPHLVASWLGHTPAVLAALEPVPLVAGDVAGSLDEGGRLLAAVGGRGLSAGAARAAAQLAAAGGQGSVWDPPDAPGGLVDDDGGASVGGAGRPVAVPGPVDARHLVRALEAPLREQQRAAKRGGPAPATEHVWHVALRNADHDRRLSDAEWAQVAADVVHRTGLSPRGADGRPVEGGCPWVAVRHDDSSIHLVVVLAREDGRAVRLWRDYRQLRDACRAAEQAYGLTATAPADRTADTHTSRAEVEKATRLAAAARASIGTASGAAAVADGAAGGQPRSSRGPELDRLGAAEPARDQLRRHVQAVAAASGSEREFFARLEAGGLLVHRRWSVREPGQVTGYAVALPPSPARRRDQGPGVEASGSVRGTGRTGDGAPVFFGGGKLAPDLTLSQLRHRWTQQQPRQAQNQPEARLARASGAGEAWRQAGATVEAARVVIDQARESGATVEQQAEAVGAAWAAADVLTVTARLLEGPAGAGPLSAAARAYGRAARPTPLPQQRVGSAGSGLRRVAALLGAAGRANSDGATMLRLVAQIADLVEAVQGLREAQRHAAQAAAARAATTTLRTAVRQAAPAALPAAVTRAAVRTPTAELRETPRSDAQAQPLGRSTAKPTRRPGPSVLPATPLPPQGRRR